MAEHRGTPGMHTACHATMLLPTQQSTPSSGSRHSHRSLQERKRGRACILNTTVSKS